MDTITHIAKPEDNRCKWFQAKLSENLTVENLESIKFDYYRRGADLELEIGTLLIDWEEVSHRKNRGFITMLGFVTAEGVSWIKPTMERKMFIKSEGHKDLMKGSGDVSGVIRMALFIQKQENKEEAFLKLKSIIV